MKGLLEDRQGEQVQADATAGEIELVLDRDREFRELALRCRWLLAQQPAANCPPGHWLG